MHYETLRDLTNDVRQLYGDWPLEALDAYARHLWHDAYVRDSDLLPALENAQKWLQAACTAPSEAAKDYDYKLRDCLFDMVDLWGEISVITAGLILGQTYASHALKIHAITRLQGRGWQPMTCSPGDLATKYRACPCCAYALRAPNGPSNYCLICPLKHVWGSEIGAPRTCMQGGPYLQFHSSLAMGAVGQALEAAVQLRDASKERLALVEEKNQ